MEFTVKLDFAFDFQLVCQNESTSEEMRCTKASWYGSQSIGCDICFDIHTCCIKYGDIFKCIRDQVRIFALGRRRLSKIQTWLRTFEVSWKKTVMCLQRKKGIRFGVEVTTVQWIVHEDQSTRKMYAKLVSKVLGDEQKERHVSEISETAEIIKKRKVSLRTLSALKESYFRLRYHLNSKHNGPERLSQHNLRVTLTTLLISYSTH